MTTHSSLPISLDDVLSARDRIHPYLQPTALRQYEPLNTVVGNDIQVLIKHENHNPTNAFKVRNAISAMTMLSPEERQRGVIAATRGNHGQGLAYAGTLLGIPVTICAPVGNNPEKNEAMRGFGAELIEAGRDYDEALVRVEELTEQRGLTMLHGTNNRHILAGAGTITLEVIEQEPALDAMVIAIGGGSQAVGALTVLQSLRPEAKVYAVQASGAAAIYESWKAGSPLTWPSADTFADGVATRSTYEMTFPALLEGLAGFVTVTDGEIAEAVRILLRTTHNLVEGAGACGLAGVLKLGSELAGKKVGIILSGGNMDRETLMKVVSGEL